MSKFKTIYFLDGLETPVIQLCSDIIENVLEHGLEIRQLIIKRALAKLEPIPRHWKKSRSASTSTETPLTTAAAEGIRTSKSPKKSWVDSRIGMKSLLMPNSKKTALFSYDV